MGAGDPPQLLRLLPDALPHDHHHDLRLHGGRGHVRGRRGGRVSGHDLGLEDRALGGQGLLADDAVFW